MIDDSYGQYATQIKGNILFHSVCYTEKDPSTLMTEDSPDSVYRAWAMRA